MVCLSSGLTSAGNIILNCRLLKPLFLNANVLCCVAIQIRISESLFVNSFFITGRDKEHFRPHFLLCQPCYMDKGLNFGSYYDVFIWHEV